MLRKKIGFIGAGNMAGAIIDGILQKNIAVPSQLTVCNKQSEERRHKFSDKGINVAKTISEVAKSCEIVFLAVKPQDFETVLAELKSSIRPECVIVSIAAGISIGYIKKMLGFNCKTVRAMPNTPLMLGEGATALSFEEPVSRQEFDEIKDIFEADGIVSVLPEEQMNAVISVNSSSPVYVYLLARAVMDGSVQQGIEAHTAKELFCKTLIGSAKMIMESGKSPDELVKMVASPGGTTLAALKALNSHHFEEAVREAMQCCTRRAEELGR